MNGGNATWLFQGESPSREGFPVSEEHFWTTIFALFLLHLGEGKGESKLSIFRCKQPGRQGASPCFERGGDLHVCGVRFEDVAIEPKNVNGSCFAAGLDGPWKAGGFDPDVLLRICTSDSAEKSSFAVVENKRGGRSCGGLARGQMENYPLLVEYLKANRIDCRFLLLMSLACSEDGKLWEQAVELQDRLKGKFGILLWEDIFRHMARAQFRLAGIDIDEWSQKYTGQLDDAVERHPVAQA
jgi:hypothetical protein